MEAALELEAVSRRFGSRLALAPISLRLGAGTACLVEGPNGAGKTTLLRIAAGLLAATSGTRRSSGPALYARSGSGGRAVDRVDAAVARSVELTGASRREARARAEDVVRRVGLEALATRRVAELSAGERGRLSLAVVAAVRPLVVCLDEPSASLDREARGVVAAVVDELRAAGSAVLVSTHDPELLPEPDARLVLAAGQVVRA